MNIFSLRRFMGGAMMRLSVMAVAIMGFAGGAMMRLSVMAVAIMGFAGGAMMRLSVMAVAIMGFAGGAMMRLSVMAVAIMGFAGGAVAAQPEPWQMGFQSAVTENMERITSFNNFLLILTTVIVLFVLALMIYVFIRFNENANPKPSKFSHNTVLEVVWTLVPILILLVIAIPSFRLLYFQRDFPEIELTIKATGYQWYWGYEYPDNGNFAFDSLMLEDDERNTQPRLLATDTAMVVPVDTNIRLQVIGGDVLHSWAMPAFGIKIDAVPGRLNETWFNVKQTGTYYGQCSELCGLRHSFMPIRVEVVEKEAYAAWVKVAQREYAGANASQFAKLTYAPSPKQ